LTTVVAATVTEEKVASDSKSTTLVKITFIRMMYSFTITAMSITSCERTSRIGDPAQGGSIT
jgi:hypothetical protein